MNNWPARIAVTIACTLIALIGVGAAGAFVCFAIYAFLTQVMAPPYAALCVAAMVLILTALLLGFILLLVKVRDYGDEAEDTGNLMGLQLGKLISGDLLALIARNPRAAVLAAIAGGVVVGISPRLRQALLDLLRR